MKEHQESSLAAPEMVSTVIPKNNHNSNDDDDGNDDSFTMPWKGNDDADDEQTRMMTPGQARLLLRRMKRRLFLQAVPEGQRIGATVVIDAQRGQFPGPPLRRSSRAEEVEVEEKNTSIQAQKSPERTKKCTYTPSSPNVFDAGLDSFTPEDQAE